MLQPAPAARPRRAAPGLAAREPGRLPAIAGLGAGGHAKCVVEAVRSVVRFRVVALLDADPALAGATVLGCPVIAGDGVAALRAGGVDHAFVGIGGTGDAGPRRTAAALLREAGFLLPAIVHRSASVARSAALAEGAQVLAGAVVGADAALGRDALVNAGAIVGHDVVVGECAHLASGARVAGAAVVGPGAHVGTGAVVLQGLRVGAGAVIGAGAVVVEDVPAGARVAGVPATPLAARRRVA